MKILFISSSSCATCREQERQFDQSTLADMDIIVVDVDNSDSLAIAASIHFHATDVPTTVLVKDDFDIDNKETWSDNEIHKWIGYVEASKIEKFIESY